MDFNLADELTSSKNLLYLLRGLFESFESLAIRCSDRDAPVYDDLVTLAIKDKPPKQVYVIYDVPDCWDPESEMHDPQDLSGHREGGCLLSPYAGNFELYQCIDFLLKAALRLPAGSALKKVIVRKKDKHIAHYRSTCDRLCLSEWVVLIGLKPLHLGSILAQADILLSRRITDGNAPMKLYSYNGLWAPDCRYEAQYTLCCSTTIRQC